MSHPNPSGAGLQVSKRFVKKFFKKTLDGVQLLVVEKLRRLSDYIYMYMKVYFMIFG